MIFKRIFRSLTLAALLVAAAPALAAGDDKAGGPGDLLAIAKAFVADKNCAVAAPTLRELTTAADFERLESADRSLAWQMLGYCLRGPEAYDAFKHATAESDVAPYAWRMRFWYAVDAKDTADALVALTGAAAVAASGVDVNDAPLWSLLKQLAEAHDDVRREAVFKLLDAHGWTPKEAATEPDGLWGDYVLLLLAKGDTAEARRVGGRIVHPEGVLRVRLDRRFLALTEGDGARAFDPVKAVEARLAAQGARAAEKPGDPDRVAAAAGTLRLLGRPAEGLATIDAWIAGHKADASGDDAPDLNWILDERAETLAALGRRDEALAAGRTAAALKEQGGANVSQTINLAEQLEDGGQPQAALDVLAVFKEGGPRASVYGMMWVWAERACALGQLGKTAATSPDLGAALAYTAEHALAYTAEHAQANPPARAETLLCVGDLDGAAGVYIARLKDPEQRFGALMVLSSWKRPPQPAFLAEIYARLDKVRVRPDVKAAVAAVGRTESYPLAGGLVTF